MHPYQNQVDKMWELIKLKSRAQKNESWIETICLSYMLLEVELRLLLSSKAGRSGIPIPPNKIDEQRYLINLANLAKDEGFIDGPLWETIEEFNSVRKKAIHRFVKSEISYQDLKEPALNSIRIMGNIQSKWLPIEWGAEESVEDPKERN